MTVAMLKPGGRRPAPRATTKMGTDMRRIEGEIVIDHRWRKVFDVVVAMSGTSRAAGRASRAEQFLDGPIGVGTRSGRP